MSHVATNIEQAEPEVVSEATPALLPPTEDEVRQVLAGIDNLIARNPNVAADPTTLLVVRLGLAFLGNQDAGKAEQEALSAESLREVQRLTEENYTLREKLTAAEVEVEDARMIAEDAQGQVDNLIDDLAKTKKHLEAANRREPDVEAERIKAELRSVVNVLDNTNAKVPKQHSTAKKVQAVLQELAHTTTEFGATREKLLAAEANLGTAKTAAEEAKRAKKAAERATQKLKKAIRDTEYGALSSQYTFRRTGKKIPCCPSCGGLDPDQVENTPHAGHRRGCWFKGFVDRNGR